MSESVAFAGDSKADRYREALPQVRGVVEGEPDLVANLANIVAVLRECVTSASWIGFYIMRDGELVLGPFQGKVACVRIAVGRGVCGTAAAQKRTVIVSDVEQFPGHIACDAGSRSEIVVPIVRDGIVVAVLDVDSYDLAAFDEEDAAGLAPIAELCGTLAW
ncbi:MAG: GAF domain-containing protein [Kofleriaceae bacterium]